MSRRPATGAKKVRPKATKKPEIEQPTVADPKLSRDEIALKRMSAPEVAVRREFSKNLQMALAERGWNGSELARQAAKHMADGKFGKDMVSKYLRGLAMPYPSSLAAMCRALRKKPEDLVPPEAYQTMSTAAPEMEMTQAAEAGIVWLRVNKKVPLDVAAEVIKLLSRAAAE